jgi:hypothetical protein
MPFCVTLYLSDVPFCSSVRVKRHRIAMKLLINVGAAAAAAGALLAVTSLAFAQNSPGVPGGILQDQFQLQQHPQMEFAASAPSKKYQHGPATKMRKQGDLGNPDGCNLQCPNDDN